MEEILSEKSVIMDAPLENNEKVPEIEEVKAEVPVEAAEELKPMRKERKKRKKGRKIPKGKIFQF